MVYEVATDKDVDLDCWESFWQSVFGHWFRAWNLSSTPEATCQVDVFDQESSLFSSDNGVAIDVEPVALSNVEAVSQLKQGGWVKDGDRDSRIVHSEVELRSSSKGDRVDCLLESAEANLDYIFFKNFSELDISFSVLFDDLALVEEVMRASHTEVRKCSQGSKSQVWA